MFTALIPISTSVLISNGLNNRPRCIMLLVLLFMYAVSASGWAINMKIAWDELNVLLPGSFHPASEVSEDNLLSDAIVLWRTCVIWNLSKAIVSMTVLVLICLLGINVAYTLTSAAWSIPSISKAFPHLSTVEEPILVALFSASAFANVWATSMIGCKTWTHQRDIRRYLRDRPTRSAVGDVLLLLVESGIVYSMLTTVLALTSFFFVPPFTFGAFPSYWTSTMTQISGMYPTLVVVVIMALQRMLYDPQVSSVKNGPDEAPISFAIHVLQSFISESSSLPLQVEAP
ncbi:hypothetical protein OF83DRAFT_1124035 [Amylostereum chailletii]|nr:hypothetical protein OF83DRAFT_1124035 [Amylostereum chailletii]